jgi:hypothetical protein
LPNAIFNVVSECVLIGSWPNVTCCIDFGSLRLTVTRVGEIDRGEFDSSVERTDSPKHAFDTSVEQTDAR